MRYSWPATIRQTGVMAPLVALTAAANATTTIRLGTHVLANDFRNPVLLAQEAATLDLLSGGRFESGIGTGWWREDYTSIGELSIRLACA